MGMIIEVGKYYRTRNNQKARVLATDRKYSAYPVVGLLEQHSTEEVIVWTAEGKYSANNNNENTLDLVGTWFDPPTVNWATMPHWANWVAQNENGVWCWYEEEPKKLCREWISHSNHGKIPEQFAPTNLAPWHYSLAERP